MKRAAVLTLALIASAPALAQADCKQHYDVTTGHITGCEDYGARAPNDRSSQSDPQAAKAQYDPSIPWQARNGALLCPNYFAMKDAKASVSAGDKSWLDKTGCVQAAGGLRVVLIEAPLAPSLHPYGRPSPSSPWRGRVYPPENGREGVTVYFDPDAVLTYAVPTVPYKLKDTDMVMSGDKQIEFKSPADAERWYAQNVSGDYKKYVAHSIVSIGSAARLLLGPADYGWLLLLCADGKPSCQITGKLP